MIGQLITKLFTGEASIYIARLRTAAAIYAAMALLALGMIGFLLGALFVWLAHRFGTVQTAIGFAIVCLVGILGLYVLLTVARRPPRQRAADRVQRDVASIASIAALSNMPLIFSTLRRRKSLVLLPVVGVAAWGLIRSLRGFRDRGLRD
jgi:ABC-type uncharacterized transport system permease subunit